MTILCWAASLVSNAGGQNRRRRATHTSHQRQGREERCRKAGNIAHFNSHTHTHTYSGASSQPLSAWRMKDSLTQHHVPHILGDACHRWDTCNRTPLATREARTRARQMFKMRVNCREALAHGGVALRGGSLGWSGPRGKGQELRHVKQPMGRAA